MSYSNIGKSVIKIDAKEKVLGKSLYPADYYRPGMIFGKTLRSDYVHANIINIDTTKAEQVPGVKVLTGKDIPGHNAHGVLHQHQPILADKRVKYIGDAVALAGGPDLDLVEEALSLIQVDYEELPVLSDPDKAMEPDAIKIHDDGNIAYHLKIRKGDVEKAFQHADEIVENTYKVQMVDHAFLQPEAALAEVDDRGNVVLYVATQYAHWDRLEIANALNVSTNKIRVITTAVGGAFGGREDMTLQVHACLLAMKFNKPVKMVYDRKESFLAHCKRHPMKMQYKTGANKEGYITAAEVKIIGDTGAYASWAPNILRKAGVHAVGPYEVPNVKVDSYAVYTNNPFAGAMRGFGAAQPPMAHEAQIDIIARKLGIDPIEIRLKNALKLGSQTATGQILESSVGLVETIKATAKYFPEKFSAQQEVE
ncbi:MAG: molybdopterin cofactor-binding domain-containing protein [Bacillota bacterium]|nr:molybdopterin cofactor-binding domain-containing protein [Bacillota bacterium]